MTRLIDANDFERSILWAWNNEELHSLISMMNP